MIRKTIRVTVFILAVAIGGLYAATATNKAHLLHSYDYKLTNISNCIAYYANGKGTCDLNAPADEESRQIFAVTLFNLILLIIYLLVIILTMLGVSISDDSKPFYRRLKVQRAPISNAEQRKWIDSIYFLGFVMTLVSLITALGGVTEDDKQKLVGATIVQNAIALSSTAFSLVIRTIWILIVSLDDEETEPLEEVEIALRKHAEALSDAIDTLKTETLGVSEAISNSSQKITASTTQFLEAIASGINSNNKAFVTGIEANQKHLEDALQPVGASLNKFATDVTNIEIDSEIISNQVSSVFNDVAATLTSSLDHLANEIDNKSLRIAGSIDNLERSIGNVDFAAVLERQINASLTPLSAMIKTQTTLSEVEVKAYQTLVKNFIQNVGVMIRAVQVLSQKINETDPPLEGFNASFSDLRKGFDGFAAAAGRLGNIDAEVKLANSKMDAMLNRLANLVSGAGNGGNPLQDAGLLRRIWRRLFG